MKIICIGLPKTGTTSLHEALQLLGFSSVHFPSDKQTVLQLREGNYRLKVLEDHDAISDVPIPAVFPQLDEAFPGSKFINTTRPVGAWLKSQKNAPFNSDTPEPGTTRDFYRAILYGVTAFNEDRFRFVYEDHYRKVASYFANRPNDLLTMDLTRGAGWKELCEFLKVAVPNVPFPRSNVASSPGSNNKASMARKLSSYFGNAG